MTTPHPGMPEFYAISIPDSPALVDGSRTLTWAEWNDRADRLATSLEDLGIGAGDRVALRMHTRWEWFAAYLALSKLGASALGVNWRLTPSEFSYILTDSGVKAGIFDDDPPGATAGQWHGLGLSPVVSLQSCEEGLAHTFDDLIANARARKYFARSWAPLIFYTSGTTGKPKGVFPDMVKLAPRLTEVMEYRISVAEAVPTHQGAHVLTTMPLHHAAGPGASLGALAKGGTVYLLDRYSPEEALGLIDRHKITHWTAVPTMLHRIQALDPEIRGQFDVSSIRALTLGAAVVPFTLKKWAITFFGPTCLYEGYGSTETSMLTFLGPADQLVRPRSSGKPVRHVSIRIVGDDGWELPAGEIGEIFARTPLTVDRYLNREPMAPDMMTQDGYFRTGDVGYFDSDGYLYVTDRKKDLIIAGGVNIYPAEIEDVLLQHPLIRDAAVIGIPHDEFGEQILAFCEVKDGNPIDESSILELCRQRLASYKIPRYFRFMAELPRNATGKILKMELRAPFWQGHERNI